MGFAATREALYEEWPGRREQIDALLGILGDANQPEPPEHASLFVFGGPTTGKTSVVKAVLEMYNRPFAYVSCLTCTTQSLLFKALLSGLRTQPTSSCGEKERRCDKIADFLEAVRQLAPKGGKTLYLVVDEVERLRDRGNGGVSMTKEILPVFARLPELTKTKICTIWISRLRMGQFTGNTMQQTPKPVYFPPYDDSALLNILVKERPSDIEQKQYAAFVQPMLGTFGRANRSIHELRTMIAELWPKYKEPEKVEGKQLEPSKLWTTLMRAYGRTGTGGMVGANVRKGVHPHMAVPLSADALALARGSGGAAPSENKLEFEISYMSKMLLLAAYVAARTPQTLDKHVFSASRGDGGGGKRRKMNGTSMDRRMEDARAKEMAGPGSFPIERLLAIMQVLVQDATEDTKSSQREQDDLLAADPFMQVTSLVSLNLLSHGGKDILDAGTQYTCNIGDELACRLAKNVCVPLEKYVIYA